MQDGGIKKPAPIDEHVAQYLLEWYEQTPFKKPSNWVFATDSNRAGGKRGEQPLWLSTVMRYHIQPAVVKLGIKKKVSWHTFRHTYSTMLRANGEDVKVVQELLRHASARITLDTYSQALSPQKRAAQSKVVSMIRSNQSVPSVYRRERAAGTWKHNYLQGTGRSVMSCKELQGTKQSDATLGFLRVCVEPYERIAAASVLSSCASMSMSFRME